MKSVRFVLLFPLIASFAVQQKCDLAHMAHATPQQIQETVKQGLFPYFPNAVVQVYPKEQILIAYTCTRNVGNELVVQIAQKMPEVPDMQKLKTLRELGPLLGISSYRRFVLGFEHEAISIEVDQNLQPVMLRLPNQQAYEQEYNRTCGFSTSAE